MVYITLNPQCLVSSLSLFTKTIEYNTTAREQCRGIYMFDVTARLTYAVRRPVDPVASYQIDFPSDGDAVTTTYTGARQTAFHMTRCHGSELR